MRVPDTISVRNFNGAIKSEHTRDTYERNLRYFLAHIGLDPESFVRLDQKRQTQLVDGYISDMKKLIAPNTVRNRYSAIKLFCVMNDGELNFAKLEKKLPSIDTKKERLPTREETKSLYDNCRFQGRVLLRLVIESGARIEGACELGLDDFEPIDNEICKITVYSGSKDEYVTFCSMETFEMIKKLTQKPRPNKLKDGKKRIFPRLGGARAILYRAWKRAGVKVDFPSNHFARKWFKTNAERSGAKSLYIEALMGHTTGLNKNYMREELPDLIKAYKQILPYLSLNGEKAKELDSVKEQLTEYKAGMDLIRPILAQLAKEAKTKEFTFTSPDGKQVYKLTTDQIAKMLEGKE